MEEHFELGSESPPEPWFKRGPVIVTLLVGLLGPAVPAIVRHYLPEGVPPPVEHRTPTWGIPGLTTGVVPTPESPEPPSVEIHITTRKSGVDELVVVFLREWTDDVPNLAGLPHGSVAHTVVVEVDRAAPTVIRELDIPEVSSLQEWRQILVFGGNKKSWMGSICLGVNGTIVLEEDVELEKQGLRVADSKRRSWRWPLALPVPESRRTEAPSSESPVSSAYLALR